MDTTKTLVIEDIIANRKTRVLGVMSMTGALLIAGFLAFGFIAGFIPLNPITGFFFGATAFIATLLAQIVSEIPSE